MDFRSAPVDIATCRQILNIVQALRDGWSEGMDLNTIHPALYGRITAYNVVEKHLIDAIDYGYIRPAQDKFNDGVW
jgi:hypothetical protein